MKRTAFVAVLMAVLLAGVVADISADEKVTVYSGDCTALTLGSWGSGLIEMDDEERYLRNTALRIETKGFYEGGRLDLREPVPGATFLRKPEQGYLSLAVMVPEPEQAQPAGPAFPGDPGAFPAEPGAAPVDPGMAPPVEPGMEPPGDIWIPDQGQMTRREEAVKISRLRVLVVTDKGELDSGPIDIEYYPEIVQDWRNIVLPLSTFEAGADLSDASIQGVALFGDAEERFYLGELVLGQEDQPLVADAGDKMTVEANAEVTFKAKPQAQGVTANYVWDFDDLDGLQEQGYGPEATWTFLTPGYYTVTLMVSDPAGRKVTRMDRLAVKVE